jgi:hypothetical protein
MALPRSKSEDSMEWEQVAIKRGLKTSESITPMVGVSATASLNPVSSPRLPVDWTPSTDTQLTQTLASNTVSLPASDNTSGGTLTAPDRDFHGKKARVRLSDTSKIPFLDIENPTQEDQIKLASDIANLRESTLALNDDSPQYQENVVQLGVLDKTQKKISSNNIKIPGTISPT